MRRPTRHLIVVALAMVVAWGASARAQEDPKICKLKTKTMGCTLEQAATTLEATSRAAATAVTAAGSSGGKCEIDSPSITPDKQSTTSGLPCTDASLSDTSDTAVMLCQTAAGKVRTACKTLCAKLRKLDPLSGDPVPSTPCRWVIDRSIVTTSPVTRTTGSSGCTLTCEASIVCVCDP